MAGMMDLLIDISSRLDAQAKVMEELKATREKGSLQEEAAATTGIIPHR